MYETEKTILLYLKNDKINKFTIEKPFDIDILFADKISIYLDVKLDGIGTKLDTFMIYITNDPKTSLPFAITNLGYYSISITGNDCDCYYFNEKTLLVFKRENFNIHYNMNIYFPIINGFELNNIFSLNTGLTSFKFLDDTNYKLNCSVWKDNNLNSFYIDLLSFENNYKFQSKEEISLLDCMEEKKLL